MASAIPKNLINYKLTLNSPKSGFTMLKWNGTICSPLSTEAGATKKYGKHYHTFARLNICNIQQKLYHIDKSIIILIRPIKDL